ncbi:hypothetical protein [Endozoicomonas sp. SESOKO3]|uniref:hypothetical protein n=1 Tax=Endozoicomonas sp. SESOKO3 TaxID=2828744 RepID=UPI0021488799|nr:hypothetical protein [Endozoicomonas sp. SESOKO3]
MSEQANSDSIFSNTEAVGAVRMVALALVNGELNVGEQKAAAKVLKEAHFTLELEQIEIEESGGIDTPLLRETIKNNDAI